MASNYPPGMTGGTYGRGVYKTECPEKGTIYLYGYQELGGLFFYEEPDRNHKAPYYGVPFYADEWDFPTPICECDNFEDHVWEFVDAARCTTITGQARNPWDDVIEHTVACGAWTEEKLHIDPVHEDTELYATITVWLCPEGHEFETEDW